MQPILLSLVFPKTRIPKLKATSQATKTLARDPVQASATNADEEFNRVRRTLAALFHRHHVPQRSFAVFPQKGVVGEQGNEETDDAYTTKTETLFHVYPRTSQHCRFTAQMSLDDEQLGSHTAQSFRPTTRSIIEPGVSHGVSTTVYFMVHTYEGYVGRALPLL